ncbi:MAG: Uma2 family endonuclease [Jaaginema sp. PMC 1079.18]|nr:Uma2 family endonuclease [Jaaginema sp. PMC 1080.18]MEC4851228.1 Uma2 family endonuclease [Jaaginema sp. PMC 1079.18]MEC4867920.1 Uma2 family endonuclease [Jaaginema sp. PMC 1078.18]
MSVKSVREDPPQNLANEEEIPLPPTDLPYDDGEPLESNRHRIAMNVLIESLHQAYQEREDYYTSGNMFVYYSSEQVRNQDFRGPDFFAVLNVDGTRERRSWIVWEEGGRYPDAIVEFMSPSTANIDKREKKRLYGETFRTRDYFVYDPFDGESLQGWNLQGTGEYEDLTPNERGWLWCESLGLWLGTWEGTILKETAIWLRFYDRDRNLVLLAQEERDLAQEERDLAQEERDLERERAEQERQQREQVEANLAAERQKNQQLRDRLLQMGIDPDSV